MPTYVMGEGVECQVMDKTRPIAKQDYDCVWGEANGTPHKIRKGEYYVRVVYKLAGTRFESDHICLNCWCGVPENAEDKLDANDQTGFRASGC